MAEGLQETMSGFQGLNTVMEQGVAHAREQEQIWSGMGKMWALLEVGAIGALLKTTQFGHRVHDAFAEIRATVKDERLGAIEDAARARAAVESLGQEYIDMADAANMRNDADVLELSNMRAQVDLAESQVSVAESRIQLANDLEQVNSKIAFWVGVAFTALFNTLREHQRINQALIAGNSSLRERLRLTHEVFGYQALTGASAHESAAALSAMSEYGLDLKDSFKESAVLITQMQQGLGVSEASTARMIFMSRIHRTNARAIADDAVRTVEATALSATEYVRIADSVQTAMLSLRDDLPKGDAAVIAYLARLEGRLKQVGGVQGEITKFYERVMTTTDGAGLGLMLGVTPEQIASGDGAALLGEGIKKLVVNSTRGLTGIDRLAQLEALSQITSISIQTLSRYGEAMDQTSASVGTATSIEERWKRQIEQTGDAVSTMISRSYALLQRGLMPVLEATAWVLARVTRAFSDLVTWAEGSEGVTTFLKVTLTSAFTTAAAGGAVLARQMWKVGVSALAVSRALASQATANVALAATGGLPRGSALALGRGGMVAGAITMARAAAAGAAAALTVGLGVVAGAAVAVAIPLVLTSRAMRKALAESMVATHGVATVQDNLKDTMTQAIRAAASSNNRAELDRLFAQMRGGKFGDNAGLGEGVRNLEFQEQMIAEIGNVANFKMGEVFRETGGGLVSATDAQTAVLLELLEYQKLQTAETAEERKTLHAEGLKKSTERQAAARAEEQKDLRRQLREERNTQPPPTLPGYGGLFPR